MTPYDVIVFAIRDYRADLWADADDLASAILDALRPIVDVPTGFMGGDEEQCSQLSCGGDVHYNDVDGRDND